MNDVVKTKTKFLYDDGSVRIIDINHENFRDDLAPGVYSVQFHPMLKYFYLKIERNTFKVPTKVYGNSTDRVEKVVKTYEDRDTNTGILLTGIKGAGKTLLAQMVCNAMIEEVKIPVIIVNEPYAGSDFNAFIEQLGECVIMFDEFGKMYGKTGYDDDEDNANQDSLLSLLDGFSRQKRMFILTENNIFSINNYLLDRPSRIYYHFEYNKLDEDSLAEYCSDRGLTEDVTGGIVEVSRQMDEFNFDVLQTIVEECIRYEVTRDTLVDHLDDLNINYQNEREMLIQIEKVVEELTNKELPLTPDSKKIQRYSTSSRYSYIHYYVIPDDAKDDKDFHSYEFTHHSCEYTSPTQLIFRRNGHLVIAKPVSQESGTGIEYYNAF